MKKYLIPILLGITILSTSVAIVALGSPASAGTRNGFNENVNNDTRYNYGGMIGQPNRTTPSRQGNFGMMGQYGNYDTTISTDLSGSDYTKLTLKAALDVVLLDEYKARAEYQAIVTQFGSVSPYVQLINAETRHIAALSRIYDAFDFVLPSDTGAASVVLPSSLEAGYQIGIDAETANIALYATYLKTDLPVSIERIFTNLQNASENHLAIFTAAKNGELFTSSQGCFGANRRTN
jgi:hypothetical protein